MSEWLITVWLVGAGLLGAVETVAPVDAMICHVQRAVSEAEPCPCGDVCDSDVADDDVKDDDIADEDACDGCDPDDEDERDDDEGED